MRENVERPEELEAGRKRSSRILVVGFLIIIGLMVVLSVIAVTRMETMHSHLESLIEWDNVRVAHAYQMRVAVRDRMLAMNQMVLEDDEISREEIYERYLEMASVFMVSRTEIEGMIQNEGERDQLKVLQRLAAVVTPLNDRVANRARENQREEASRVLLEEAVPAQLRVLEQIDEILDQFRTAAKQLETQAHHELERAITLFLSLAGLALVMSGLIAVFTVYRVQRDRVALIEAYDIGARMHYMAHHDPLSGLFNRAGMSENLQLALQRADSDGSLSAALLLDLDGFKMINDTYSHDVGDQLLISVAQRLVNSVKSDGDSVSRLAGDEFVILLCGLKSRDDADLVAERILKQLGEPHRLAGQDLRVMASIGIAVYPADADSGSALLHCADLAMYQAKEKGKCGYCHYTATYATDATQRA